jgi:hypothetical protein
MMTWSLWPTRPPRTKAWASWPMRPARMTAWLSAPPSNEGMGFEADASPSNEGMGFEADASPSNEGILRGSVGTMGGVMWEGWFAIGEGGGGILWIRTLIFTERNPVRHDFLRCGTL